MRKRTLPSYFPGRPDAFQPRIRVRLGLAGSAELRASAQPVLVHSVGAGHGNVSELREMRKYRSILDCLEVITMRTRDSVARFLLTRSGSTIATAPTSSDGPCRVSVITAVDARQDPRRACVDGRRACRARFGPRAAAAPDHPTSCPGCRQSSDRHVRGNRHVRILKGVRGGCFTADLVRLTTGWMLD
jgi:hypothetical protein